MLIANADDGKGGTIIFIGLSRENINRLTANHPIVAANDRNARGALPNGLQIRIFFGETEQAMKQLMESAGVIGPDTKTFVDPRL